MKTRLFFVLITVCFLLVGCFDNAQKYDDKTIQQAEEKIANFIKKNFEGVEKVTFDGYTKSPMGGEMFNGKVNGKAEFSASFNLDDFEIGSIVGKKGFPPIKEACKDKICE
ncbi:DUF1433 domain-containing protein [Virgibacillus sp. 179-BFC.A HS]|uniref:DUF1433 domain-containing protein n=1 Tax=Tigheibacillus jepli TaxID=3035914 RepID=A0ABU5CET1_9BACI|nr:DUF1433 domain-containing protein [Virgibacillus sp. 179-BFC.A HS]MDY0404063.1 DUF1433 domain-containing protein [Virgibacillus sp. 179-BFC.A HS]